MPGLKKRGRRKGNKQVKKELSGADADADSEGSLSDSGRSVCSQEERLPVRYTAVEIKEFMSVTKRVLLRSRAQKKRFMCAVQSESGDLVSEPSEIRRQTVSFFSKLFEREQASSQDVEERFFPLQASITQKSATLLDAELSLGMLYEA
ncbi:hypothetical protein AOLI_G00056040 [Acnodon oligacanthus]